MESYGLLEALDTPNDKENIFMFKIVSDNLQFKPKVIKILPLFLFQNI